MRCRLYRDRRVLRAAGERMSLIAEVIEYGKDIILVGERVDHLRLASDPS